MRDDREELDMVFCGDWYPVVDWNSFDKVFLDNFTRALNTQINQTTWLVENPQRMGPPKKTKARRS